MTRLLPEKHHGKIQTQNELSIYAEVSAWKTLCSKTERKGGIGTVTVFLLDLCFTVLMLLTL